MSFIFFYKNLLVLKSYVCLSPALVFASAFIDSLSDAASLSSSDPVQSQNYFKNVSENKEIIKLVSLLSSAINSTKRVRQLRC